MHQHFINHEQEILDRIAKEYRLDETLISDIKSVMDQLVQDFKAGYHGV